MPKYGTFFFSASFVKHLEGTSSRPPSTSCGWWWRIPGGPGTRKSPRSSSCRASVRSVPFCGGRSAENFTVQPSITHRIHVWYRYIYIYMLTWLGYIDGIHVTIYSSTMDPMGKLSHMNKAMRSWHYLDVHPSSTSTYMIGLWTWYWIQGNYRWSQFWFNIRHWFVIFSFIHICNFPYFRFTPTSIS